MKWEYRIIKVHEDLLQREFGFNALGDERWILVSVDGDTAYFKRPRGGESQARETAVKLLNGLSKRDDNTSQMAMAFVRNTIGIANTIESQGWDFPVGHDLIKDILYPSFMNMEHDVEGK